MWRCEPCGAEAEDHFEVCGSCGRPRDGMNAPGAEASEAPGKRCPTCDAELELVGVKRLLLGGRPVWSLFGRGAGPRRRVRLVEYWTCTRCRRLELYETG